MELRHLRYFVAVAQTCHFGQAADLLHIAQPALSQAIRQLESELGATLLNRTTRQVALTPAGEHFLREARRALATIDAGVDGVHRIAGGSSGVLRLGLVGTAAFSHLPAIVRTLERELPGIALDVTADMLTPEQCDALRDGTLDLAVTRPPLAGEGLEMLVLEREPLVLVVPSGHRLAVAPTVSVGDLRVEPFVTYASRDSAVNQAAMHTCRAAGFVPNRRHEAAGTAVLLALVAAGLGVALAPASVRTLPLAGVVFRDLPDGGEIELGLAWSSGATNPLVESVVKVLRDEPPHPDLPIGPPSERPDGARR